MKNSAHATHPLYPTERGSDRTLDAATFRSMDEYEEKRRAANAAAYEAYLQKKAAKSNR